MRELVDSIVQFCALCCFFHIIFVEMSIIIIDASIIGTLS